MEDPVIFESDQVGEESRSVTVTGSVRWGGAARPFVLAGLVAAFGLIVAWVLLGDGHEQASKSPADLDPSRTQGPVGSSSIGGQSSIPDSLLAAEIYVGSPSAAALQDLVESVGGLDAVTLGEARGAFDLVRFDPLDRDRLLASVRSSYGDAENQGTNELWLIDQDGIAQTLWAPDTPHDFVHFNVDGTITMWVHSDEGTGFGPRTAVLFDNDGQAILSSQPVYASRFTAVGSSVFALTGDGDYYSNDRTYQQLIADGMTRRLLDSGRGYEWIDNPVPELLVAYPLDADTVTAVWDSMTFQRLDDHPLAGRSYQRVAVSGDEQTAVGITFGGRLEQIDLTTGQLLSVFGSVDAGGVDQPVTLNRDGTIAITVERSGLVTLWWVGANTPIATVMADAAQPRWVSEQYGARTASAVAPDSSRIALRLPARPRVPVTWVVIDTSIDGWIQHACDLAGRTLNPAERTALGLPATPVACG